MEKLGEGFGSLTKASGADEGVQPHNSGVSPFWEEETYDHEVRQDGAFEWLGSGVTSWGWVP